MDQVRIVYEEMQRFCKVFINDERISEFSDLAMCENKDIHVCAGRMITMLDDEIGRDYSLEIEGDAFQIELLRALSKSSRYCQEFSGRLTEYTFGIDEETAFLLSLTEKYNLAVEHDLTIRIGGAKAEEIKHENGLLVSENAEVLIEDGVPQTLVPGTTVIVFSDEISLLNEHGTTLLFVPREMFPIFFDYYHKYCKLIPLVEKLRSLCRYISLSTEDRTHFNAYIEREAKFLFYCAAEQCEKNEMISYSFAVYPLEAKNVYRLTTVTPDITEITDEGIYAKKQGTGILRVIAADGSVHAEKRISVIDRILVKSITLVPNFSFLQPGQKGQFDTYIFPENAEDAQQLTWTSSDNAVVHVTGMGEATALRKGCSIITVSSERVSASYKIEVLPALERICLSETELSIEIGQKKTFICSLVPEDAAHGELVWELDNDALGKIEPSEDGKTCLYTATSASLAKGKLICVDNNSKKTAACDISVKPEDIQSGLTAATIIVTILGLLFSFTIPVFWSFGLGIAGYFIDFLLPLSLILCFVGKRKTNNKVKIISSCLIANLLVTCAMFLLTIVCCG